MFWQAVFFDFDGVILDSVHIKTEAFGRMFRQYGEEVEKKVVSYHVEHGGISRYKKIQYFYESILGKNISNAELDALGDVFSEIVLKEVLNSPFINGAKETLEKLKNALVPAYIVSGTPDEEMHYIAKMRGLTEFFQETHGSPREKHEIVDSIIDQNGFEREKCLFVGDAMSDYKAAEKTGICFLGIVKKGEISPFPQGTPVSDVVTIDYQR